MRLSKTELQILEQIANSNKNVKEIAKALKKSKVQIYRSGQKLIENNFIVLSNGVYEPTKMTPASLLVQLLGEFSSLIEPLSDSGIKIFTCLFEPKGIKQIIQESGIKRTQIFKKIKQARAISLVKRVDKKYAINEKLWFKTADFLKELKRYEERTDKRVPGNSVIYYKNEKEIVFSTKEKLNATPTAFSAYEKYGIKILSQKNYYYLPNKKLTKEEVFKHSLYIAEKDNEPRHIIFISLFYIKYKKELSKIKHDIIENINKIFCGQHIPRYPTLEEIKDRADVYDIKI